MASDYDNQHSSEQPEPRKNGHVEWRLDLGKISSDIRHEIDHWDESAWNPQQMFGESVPRNDEEDIRRSVEKQFKKRGEFLGHFAVYFFVNLVLWGIFLFSNNLIGGLTETGGLAQLLENFPWPLFVTLGWGAGMIAHGVETFFETGERATRRDRMVRMALRDQYGPDWHDTLSKGEYSKARQQITKAQRKRVEFLQHAGVYASINLMLWVIFFFTNGLPQIITGLGIGEAVLGFPWPLIVMFGWGIGLVAHAADTYAQGGLRVNAQEAAVQRAIERERAVDSAMRSTDKPKRETMMRLGDDGELIEWVDEEAEGDKPKRRARG